MNNRPLKKIEVFNLLKNISIENLESEKVEISFAQGRILSSDILSSIDLPPFNNSAVDGYAMHTDNLKDATRLKCTQRIAAGDYKEVLLEKDEVARIFTGARMPMNSNTVVMQENVIAENDYIIISKIPKQGENWRLAGEDIAKGHKILFSGEIIKPTNLNLIAAIGKGNVEVKKKLKCKAIVGAANNQLDKSETSLWLKENNIFYAPDYLVNSGGVIAISCEINNSEEILEDQLNKISDKVLSLLKESKKSSLSAEKIVEDLAWKRINS